MFSLNEKLGIKTKKSNTESGVISVLDPKGKTTGISDTVRPKFFDDLTKLYKDPYSGEFYGEGERDGILFGFEKQLKLLDDNIKNYSSSSPITFNPLSSGNQRSSLGELEKTRESLQQSYNEFKNTKYNQSKNFFNSFEAYKPDWMKYFEQNYKNPRLAEEYANIDSRNQAEGNLTNSNLNIPTQALSRGNLNTGLGISGSGGGLGV